MKMGKVTGTVVTKIYKGAGLRAQGTGHSFTDSHAGPQAVCPVRGHVAPTGLKT